MAVPGQLWVPPWEKNWPLIFLDESQNPEKSQIITFEAFWAKSEKVALLITTSQIYRILPIESDKTLKKCKIDQKTPYFQKFHPKSPLSVGVIWSKSTKSHLNQHLP